MEDVKAKYNDYILVWKWDKAPEDLKAYSQHGGDEDYLALVPPTHEGPVEWAEGGTPFGCCSVEEHVVGGYRILIGAHA